VIAHGTGTSAIDGHPDSWLDGVHLDNVHLFVSHDAQAQYENTQAALTLRHARNFTLKDVEIQWEKPPSPTWKAGLQVEDASSLLIDGVDVPTRMTLKNVENVTVRQTRTPALEVSGTGSRKITITDTGGTLTTGSEVSKGAVVRR
jgi:hypothetical protein